MGFYTSINYKKLLNEIIYKFMKVIRALINCYEGCLF